MVNLPQWEFASSDHILTLTFEPQAVRREDTCAILVSHAGSCHIGLGTKKTSV